MARRHTITPECISIVKKVFKYFEKEKHLRKSYISLDKSYLRTAKATGIPYSSIYRAIKSEKNTGDVQKDRHTKRKKILDDFDKCVIRRTVHSMYTRKIAPTVSKIQKEISDTIQISNTLLTLTLLELGFEYKRRNDGKHALFDSTSTISDRCNYLRQIKMYCDQGYEVVYLDETWNNKNHSTDFMWLPSDSSDAPKIPSGMGKRLIVLHAGATKEGLIKGCDLVFVAKTKDGDYHNEMNSDVFLDWFENQLLPALKAPSVIVLDNASYHNTKTEQTTTPNMNNRKAVMQEWLQQHHITFAQSDTKPVLYEKIKRHKPQIVYQTDELAHQNGHVVLRTPVRHCELNPIELIWAQIKGNVAKNNTTFKLTDVKALVFREFDKITSSVWEKAESHVKKIENEYRKTDGVVEVSPIIINLCDSDDDDDD